MRIPAIFAFALALLPLGAAAQPPAPAALSGESIDGRLEYRTCLILAKKQPEQGWEEALAWQSLGGGEAARHCAAVALIGLNKFTEAASRLETLANESVREETVRAEMLAQAGQAWLMAGNTQRADAVLRAALTLSPGNPDLLLDLAVVLAQVNHYPQVVETLSTILRAQPNRVEALTLRASAFRYLDNLAGAEDDARAALRLDPDYPDAWLELGMLRRLNGDDKAAREAWLNVISLTPDGAAADTARQNLQKLDLQTK